MFLALWCCPKVRFQSLLWIYLLKSFSLQFCPLQCTQMHLWHPSILVEVLLTVSVLKGRGTVSTFTRLVASHIPVQRWVWFMFQPTSKYPPTITLNPKNKLSDLFTLNFGAVQINTYNSPASRTSKNSRYKKKKTWRQKTIYIYILGVMASR